MAKVLLQSSIVVFAGLLLTACDMMRPPMSYRAPNPPQAMTYEGQTVREAQDGDRQSGPQGQGRVSTVVSGDVGGRMDAIDRSKLSHALDRPIGKATSWTNANTGVTYTVVPVRKVTVNGNSFCRQYEVRASRGESQKNLDGTACVASDGQWQSVS